MSVTEVARHIPFLRRFARALTGSTAVGDARVAQTLKALLDGSLRLDPSLPVRVALFRAFCSQPGSSWSTPIDGFDNPYEAALQRVDPCARMVYLLAVVEEFGDAEIARIADVEPARVGAVIDAVQESLARSMPPIIPRTDDEPRARN